MTVREFLRLAAQQLYENAPPEQKDRETAAFEARMLLFHFSDVTFDTLPLCAEKALEKTAEETLLTALKEKCEGRPLQYILGCWEFYGKEIFCGEGCLIPRPETEFLAEYAVKNLPQNGRFLELCTGSGCIPTAILSERKDLVGTAVDLSEKALYYAEKNRERYGLSDRLTLICADLHDYVPSGNFDGILANPPYIRSEDMKTLSREVLREPHMALDGGEDGLHFYRVIISRFLKFLSPDGFFAFEAGEDTAAGVKALLDSAGFASETISDYGGIMRVVTGKRKKEGGRV